MKKVVSEHAPARRTGGVALLKVEEAAEALALSPKTIRMWAAAQRIGVVKLGSALRIPASEVSRLIEAGFVPARRVSSK